MRILEQEFSTVYSLNSRGTCFRKGRWEANFTDKGKTIYVGTFDTKEEAANAVYECFYQRFLHAIIDNKLEELLCKTYSHYFVFSNGAIMNLQGKVLSPHKNKSGYMSTLINGETRDIHRIIASCFIPNPKNFPQVNHKDGDKTNNNIENLEWCTRSENLKHAYCNGLEKIQRCEDHHAHKLTVEAVKYIRDNLICGDKNFGFEAMAKKFHVHPKTIRQAYNGDTWDLEAYQKGE